MKIKIKTVEIYISFLFTAFLSLLIAFDRSYTVLACFVFVLVHELAHAAALFFCGAEIKRITFEPFGVLLNREDCELTFAKKIIVSIAGVTLNLLLCLAFYVCYMFLGYAVLLQLSLINLLIAAVNSLPVKNLDGGDVAHAVLVKVAGEKKGNTVFKCTSLIFCFFMLAVGIYVFAANRFNPTLLILALNLLFFTLCKQKD